VGVEKSSIERCYEIIGDGGCEVDKSYTGPALEKLPATSSTKQHSYTISQEFIDQMIEYFKTGKCIARRYAWEIILGCHEVLAKEKSMVDVSLDKEVICDVIGDTHGKEHPARYACD
jgi:serine/threonine-protein phosphatase 5